MTNYRLNICEVHDLPQFAYCFDCGALMKEDDVPGTRTCTRNWVHLRLFVLPHVGDPETTDCDPECLTFQ